MTHSSHEEFRVLVLDDEPDVADVTMNAVSDFGYQSIYSSNSKTALELTRTQKPHILILDIDLKEPKNGIDLIQDFKALNPDLAILMLTGEYEIKVAIRAMREGAFDYILKPFDFGYLEKRLEQVVEMVRAKALSKIYFSTIVHDLKNPIQNIVLSYDFLKQMPYYQNDERYRKVVHRGRQSCMEINKMVNNILNLEKEHVGEFKTTKEAFPVVAAIQEALTIFEPVSPEDILRVKVDFEINQDLHANNDKQSLQHVLFNLISNGIRYASSKSVVSVVVTREPNQLKIAVFNQGSFIKEEDRDRIFEKFVQSDNNAPTHTQADTMNFGLGLSFCKIAVSAMGGKIWVDGNALKNETTFFFTISL